MPIISSNGDYYCSIYDQYKVQEEIGKGGFGIVARVYDTTNGKSIAMKRLYYKNKTKEFKKFYRYQPELWLYKGFKERYHPNLVKIYEIDIDFAPRRWLEANDPLYNTLMNPSSVSGISGSASFSSTGPKNVISDWKLPVVTILQELGEKGSLDKWFRRNSANRATVDMIEFCVQLSGGLQFLHAKNIIHGDFKPANVVLCNNVSTNRLILKICDFGLAHLKNNGYITDLRYLNEKTNEMKPFQNPTLRRIRTPTYMAPEQETFNPEADIFSLGLIMFEMFNPFGIDLYDQNRNLTFYKIKKEIYHTTYLNNSLWNRIPSSMVGFISSCLNKKPSRRPNASKINEELLMLQYNDNLLHKYKKSPVWYGPRRSNSQFSGRDSYLRSLIEIYEEYDSVNINGSALVGKSDLAWKFCEILHCEFDACVTWFDMKGSFPRKIQRIAEFLFCKIDNIGDDTKVDEMIRNVAKRFYPRRWVFVMNDCISKIHVQNAFKNFNDKKIRKPFVILVTRQVNYSCDTRLRVNGLEEDELPALLKKLDVTTFPQYLTKLLLNYPSLIQIAIAFIKAENKEANANYFHPFTPAMYFTLLNKKLCESNQSTSLKFILKNLFKNDENENLICSVLGITQEKLEMLEISFNNILLENRHTNLNFLIPFWPSEYFTIDDVLDLSTNDRIQPIQLLKQYNFIKIRNNRIHHVLHAYSANHSPSVPTNYKGNLTTFETRKSKIFRRQRYLYHEPAE